MVAVITAWLPGVRMEHVTNVEVNISHENTTMVVWIYDGV